MIERVIHTGYRAPARQYQRDAGGDPEARRGNREAYVS
jgi:hypothetical protein